MAKFRCLESLFASEVTIPPPRGNGLTHEATFHQGLLRNFDEDIMTQKQVGFKRRSHRTNQIPKLC